MNIQAVENRTVMAEDSLDMV